MKCLRNFVHCNAVRGEGPGCRLVLEPAEEVLGSATVDLDVVLEGVDDALALDGVGALQVEVVGEEELLGTVELAAAALGLLRAVVLAHPHAAAPVGLHLLHPSHIRMDFRVRRPHQHAVARLSARTLCRHQIPRRRNTVRHTHGGGGMGDTYLGRPCWCRGWCRSRRPSCPAWSSPWPQSRGFGGEKC
jgi:hypothetical protein